MRNFNDYNKISDSVLVNTGNPVRRIIYTKEKKNHLDIESDVTRKGSDSNLYSDD